MQLSQIDAHKRIAVKLHDMSWWQRRWLLQRLPQTSRQQVRQHLKQLQLMACANGGQLLQQLTEATDNAAQGSKPVLAQLACSEAVTTQLQQNFAALPAGVQQAISEYVEQPSGRLS